MADLMNAIATGSEPETNGMDNLKTMAIIEAGYQSLREKRCITIAEVEQGMQAKVLQR
jgi:predicted dehydrogenase